MKECIKNLWVILLLAALFLPVSVAASDLVDIHGFVSQGYLKSTDNNYLAETEDGTFEFNELGINFTTQLTDDLRLGIQFFARDLGPAGNNEITLDWAYCDYRFQDYLGIRVGQLKLVNGLYSEVRDLDMTRTSVLLPQGVYPELWRDTFSNIKGAGLYGYVEIPVIGSFFYNLQAGALSLSKDAGFARAFEENFSSIDLAVSDMDADTSYTAGLEWQPPFVDGLRFKGTYYDIKNMTVTGDASIPVGVGTTVETTLDYRVNEFSGYILSAEYMTGGLTLASEYTTGDFTGEYRINISTTNPWTARPTINTEGWYVLGAYRFTELFEWGLGFSHYYPDKNDKDGDNQAYDFLAWEKDLFSSLRFDINEYTILKFEVHDMNGFGAYSTTQDPSEKPEEDWYLFASKITFSF